MKFEIAPKSTEIQSNWEDAKLYCFCLNIDGKSGWRLPSNDELNQIYESENDFEKNWYWSSTEFSVEFPTEFENLAWNQDFTNGYQYTYGKYYGGFYVRAIRSI